MRIFVPRAISVLFLVAMLARTASAAAGGSTALTTTTTTTTTTTRRRLTTTTVYSATALQNAIANDAYIVLGSSITGGSISISGVTGLTIDGNGNTLGFSTSCSATPGGSRPTTNNGRIFYISGASEVTVVDLTLQNGCLYSCTGQPGGAVYIDGSSGAEVTFTNCNFNSNGVSGARYWDTDTL